MGVNSSPFRKIWGFLGRALFYFFVYVGILFSFGYLASTLAGIIEFLGKEIFLLGIIVPILLWILLSLKVRFDFQEYTFRWKHLILLIPFLYGFPKISVYDLTGEEIHCACRFVREQGICFGIVSDCGTRSAINWIPGLYPQNPGFADLLIIEIVLGVLAVMLLIYIWTIFTKLQVRVEKKAIAGRIAFILLLPAVIVFLWCCSLFFSEYIPEGILKIIGSG